ncbi:hypothetical protein LP420_15665 [Massilia sp. B-10]|nr:hypothetical protein LP420_15665 [Massilia sp. B-10]
MNADINVNGFLMRPWKIAADFALRPSRLFDLPLSGKGKLNADAAHVSNVDAALALGGNSADVRGSFGAPGEQLLWRVEGKQLAAVRKELMGTLSASGAVTGSMDMPRTSFEVDARGLGWTAAARSPLLAPPACCTPRAAPGWRRPARTASALSRPTPRASRAFNPAAFGDLLPGSVNASFDASGHAGADWRAALNLTIEPSTLANAPLWGYARLTADAARVERGHRSARGPQHPGRQGQLRQRVRHARLAGRRAPAGLVRRELWRRAARLGQAVRFGRGALAQRRAGRPEPQAVRPAPDQGGQGHGQRGLRPRRGRSAGRRYRTDRLHQRQHRGRQRPPAKCLSTRGAHVLRLTARGEAIDASGEVQGGFDSRRLERHRGRAAEQGPLRVHAAGAGRAAHHAARPRRASWACSSGGPHRCCDAVIKLPNGSLSVQSLEKTARTGPARARPRVCPSITWASSRPPCAPTSAAT